MSKQGIMICNIGTPKDCDPDSVGAYLNEFLMDGEVINIPYPLRYILVKWLIVPKRKYASAKNYQSVWTKEGSPLLVLTRALQKNMQHLLGDNRMVEIGMRYSEPSILSAMEKFKAAGVEEVVILPLYPQYARSSTESTFLKVAELNKKFNFKIKKIPSFYASQAFIEATAETARKHLAGKKVDHYLMSYHGLPESHDKAMEADKTYRKQCLHCSDLIAQELGLDKSQYGTSFQSRLGRAEWVKPYTDFVLKELPEKGIKNLAILCPSFVSDCLETIEEMGVEGAKTFKDAGGESFHLVPCLNERADYLVSFL